MLSMYIVIKKLHRAATAGEECFDFFAKHMNEKLTVSSIDFDTPELWTEHGIFSVVVRGDTKAQVLLTYHGEQHVEFELYLGDDKIWPKQ